MFELTADRFTDLEKHIFNFLQIHGETTIREVKYEMMFRGCREGDIRISLLRLVSDHYLSWDFKTVKVSDHLNEISEDDRVGFQKKEFTDDEISKYNKKESVTKEEVMNVLFGEGIEY